MSSLYKQVFLPMLSLCTSVGTLLCCALPALLVTLGMGAAMAGFVTAVPWVTALSDYKPLVFTVSGVLLLFATIMQWRARNAPCPSDPSQAKACTLLRRVSWFMIGFSIVVYVIGFFFAFLAAYLL